jgi:hypothetical protein
MEVPGERQVYCKERHSQAEHVFIESRMNTVDTGPNPTDEEQQAVMKPVTVSIEIPPLLAKGLAAGALERVGGAVRDVSSRETVAWLRDACELTEPLLSELLSLSKLPANVCPLTLALTTMEFAVVMRKLDAIQKQLTELQEVLHAIDYKIDLSFHANFRAALDLAANAFTMSNAETRRASALQAISRFLEAEHHYTHLTDVEIAHKSQVADDYLYTLCLAYVTEARCYLELEELETAHRRLQVGLAVVKPRMEKHVRTLLTSNPAAYLHPALKNRVDLTRLTKVYRWGMPAADENSVFEAQRDNLFELARHPDKWVDSLPQAIRLPVKDQFFAQRMIGDLTRQISRHGLTRRVTGLVGQLHPAVKLPEGVADDDVFARLPDVLELIELMIEQCSRFESYVDEVRMVREEGMTFHEWQDLPLPAIPSSPKHMLIWIT